MFSNSITKASIVMAASDAKDLNKKKRGNRSAKLKQCKLDARREQWLSQVKNKGCKEEYNGHGLDSARSIENLEIKPRGEENEGSIHHYSDSEWPSNSPFSHTSSVLGGSGTSGTTFTGSSRSSGSSGGCCSGSITEEDEEGEDGCLDDWEAVADALAASTYDKQEQLLHPVDHENTQLHSSLELASAIVISKPEPVCVGIVQRGPSNGRAWRPDDAFRPRCLPNLSKQHSFPRHYGSGSAASAWGYKNVISAPSSCPICFEDLDLTDSNFLPCSCGFHLCLFCHKRILEEDGRCPGCRKQYGCDPTEDSLAFGLVRSCSMIKRS